MITNYFKDLLLAKLDTDIEQIALATNYDSISNSTNITSVNQKYIANTTNTITSLGLKSSITIDKLTNNIATTFISGSITTNSFDVVSASGFNLGDKILVKNNYYKISNISGNTITILGNFISTPNINDSVQQIITQLHLVNNSNTTLFVDKIDLIKNNNIITLNSLINTSNIIAKIEISNDVNFIPNPNSPTNLAYTLSGNNLTITWDNMNVQRYEYELVNVTIGSTSNNTVTFDITDPFYNIDTNLTYTFKVRSINRTKVSSYSSITIKFNTLFAFYFKSIDFGNGWRGTLYAKNLESGNEYIVDTNVSVLNNWLMPRTSSNGKYIAYHTTTGGGLFDFKIKDLETGTIIYAVNDNAGNYFFCNWWANDSDRITNLYRNRTYTISTNNLNTSSPDSSFYNSWRHIITNKSGNTAYYWDNNYGFAMRKKDINGTNFSFIGAPDGYYKSLPVIDEAEDFIYYGGESSNSKIYKLNLNTDVESIIYSSVDFTDYVDSLLIGRVLDNKLYVNHKIGSNRYLKYIDLSDNSLNLVEQNNDMVYLCDVNKIDPSYF